MSSRATAIVAAMTTLCAGSLAPIGCRQATIPTPPCAASVERARAYFVRLCGAKRLGLEDRTNRLTGFELAQVTLPSVVTKPALPLVVLQDRQLELGYSQEWSWTLYWNEPRVATTAPRLDQRSHRATARASLERPPMLRFPPMAHTRPPWRRPDPHAHAQGEEAPELQLRDPLGPRAAVNGLGINGGGRGGPAAEDVWRIVDTLRRLPSTATRKEILLAIAANTPADQVLMLLDLVDRAGYERVSFLFAPGHAPSLPPDPVAPPGVRKPAPVVKRLALWNPPSSWAVRKVATRYHDMHCTDIPRLLWEIHRAGQLSGCADTAIRIQNALTDCRCPLDERPLLSLVGRFLPPLRFVALHQLILSDRATPYHPNDRARSWRQMLPDVLKLRRTTFRGVGPKAPPPGGGGHDRPQGPTFFASRATVNGGLDDAAVRRIVMRSRSTFERCYKHLGLAANPKLGGDVTVAWSVDEAGTVRSVRIRTSDLHHSPTEECIVRAVHRLRFPKPEGTSVSVIYPFHFRP